MAKKGRIRVKKGKKRKTGPKNFKEGAKQPRRAGHKKRLAFKVNTKKIGTALARYRGGYRLIWKRAGGYVRQLKHFGKPGTFDKRNHHRGAMPSQRRGRPAPGASNLSVGGAA